MNKTILTAWLLGLPGVLAMSWLALPGLLPDDAPVSAVQAGVAGTLQGALLLAGAAWAGARLGPGLGLEAPWLQAALAGRPAGRPVPWLPALLGALAGALVLAGFAELSPLVLADLTGRHQVPLLVRLLYGGVTEEILLRWGLMTALLWLLSVLAGRAGSPPSARMAALAIAASALAFGALHLPVVAALAGSLPVGVVAYVVIGNALFGLVAGFLYWRHGLEAAIVAHVLAHAGAALAGY